MSSNANEVSRFEDSNSASLVTRLLERFGLVLELAEARQCHSGFILG